jgi:hypothetical protein
MDFYIVKFFICRTAKNITSKQAKCPLWLIITLVGFFTMVSLTALGIVLYKQLLAVLLQVIFVFIDRIVQKFKGLSVSDLIRCVF